MKGTSTSLGNISLTVSIGGLIATEMALRQGLVAGAGWKVLLQAFEAATIGGFADWFAVTALFREVPVPLIRRHTNIIIKNRERIVEGIADMVQNRWLAPDIIREHLAHFSASKTVLDYLAGDEQLENVLRIVRNIIHRVAGVIDAPEVAAFLERIIKDQLRSLQFTEPFGRWLGQRLRRGDHYAVWDALLPAVENAFRAPEVKPLVQWMIGRTLDEYKPGGIFKQLGIKMARGLNLVNEEKLAAAFVARLAELVREAQSNPDHFLRSHIDGIVIEFADKLAASDAGAVAAIETVRTALVEGAEARGILNRALRRLRETLEQQSEKPDSDFNKLIRQNFQEHLHAYRINPSAQEKFDRWVRNMALELLEKRHTIIGQMVRGSLEKLSDLDLVGQIESKVGQDLQYIRLNGAIVGGFAGAMLAILKLLT
jgi:uncharacterized membrane-anchored protein YjiN (DUF445 family)